MDFIGIPVQTEADYTATPSTFMTLQEARGFSLAELSANKTHGLCKIGGVDYRWQKGPFQLSASSLYGL